MTLPFPSGTGVRCAGVFALALVAAPAVSAQASDPYASHHLAVVDVGDVDGDGLADLAIGKGWQDVGRAYDAGSVWVVRRDAPGRLGEATRITTDSGGLAATLARGERFGDAIAPLGDLDGDGVPDIAVGLPGSDDGGWKDAGAVHVLFLAADGSVKAEQRISAIRGHLNAILNTGTRFGQALATLGDVDGDGTLELAVAVTSDPGTYAGYVLSLGADGMVRHEVEIAPTSLSGSPGDPALDQLFARAIASSSGGAPLDLIAPETVTSVLDLTGSDPMADFTADVTSGVRPLFVNFTDLSVGTGLSAWSWDFGDNHFSSVQNPTHPFFVVMRFDVALTVTGTNGSDTMVKEDYIITSGGVGAIRYNGNDVNPEIYESVTAPDFGTLWTTRVNGTSIGGMGLTFIFSFADWLDPTPTQFGELLVNVQSTVYANSIASIDQTLGYAEHKLLIPADPDVFGLGVFTQAFVNNTGNGTASFTNALYVVLGVGSSG